MTTSVLHRVLFGSTLVALCVCAMPARPAAADREHQQIMADLRMLQEQAQQLQALLNALGDALKTVNARLDDQTALERKAFADGKVQMDGVSGDLRVVREKIDETNVRLSSLGQELESLRDSLPQPGTAPPLTTSDASPLPDGTIPGAAPPAAAPPTNPGISPTRLYASAFGDYSAGNYMLAVQGFTTYLQYWPKGAQAAEAQYYIGQSYEGDGKLADAVTAYERVIASYPASEQASQASYKRGFVLEKLGQLDKAKQSYEATVAEYPNAPSSSLAKQRLEALNRPTK
jgi:tol-pal system protein YbgF